MSDFAEKITLDLNGTAVDGTAQKGLSGTGDGVGSLIASLQKLAGDSSPQAAMGALSSEIFSLTGAAVASAGAITATTGAIVALGFAASSEAEKMEQLQMEIASSLGATMDFTSAMTEAKNVLPGLVDVSIKTGVGLDELSESFRKISILTKGNNADVTALTSSLATLAKTAGVDLNELISTISRATLTGQLPMRGGAGQFLALNLGLTGPEIQQAQASGDLIDLLTKKMGDQTAQGELLSNQWGTLSKAVGTASDQLLASIGTAWDPLKETLRDLLVFMRDPATRQFAKDVGEVGGALLTLEKFTPPVILAKLLWQGVSESVRAVASAISSVKEKYLELTGQTGWDAPGAVSVGYFKDAPAPETANQFADVDAAYQKLVNDMSRKNDLAGLTGLDKQLGQIAAENDENVEKLYEAWQKTNLGAAAFGQGLAQITQATAKKTQAALEADAAAQQALAEKQEADAEKWSESIARQYQKIDDLDAGLADNLAKIRKGTTLDAVAVIQEQLDAQIAATNKLAELATKQATEEAALNQGRLKDGTDLASKLTDIEQARVDKDVALEAEAALKEKTILDGRSGNWTGYYNDLVKEAVLAGAGIVEAMQSSLKTVADKAYANAATIEQGVQAFLLKIRSELKTEGQIWSDYLTGIWGGITTGLGSMLLTIETGTGSLRDELKSLYTSVLQSFNTMVEEMVKKWLFGKQEMSAGGSPLDALFGGTTQKAALDSQGKVKLPTGWSSSQVQGEAPQGGPGPAGATVTGVVGAGATGLGLGSMVGGMSGAPGFSAGAAIGGTVAAAGIALAAAGVFGGALAGAAAGSVVPILGTIIGAIIGGLIAVLSAPNTETWVNGNSLVPQLKTAGEAIQSGVVDVYTKSLLPDSAGFASSVNGIISKYIQSKGTMGAGGFQIHAGSSEDIQKDIQTLLSGVVPAALEHLLIGQKPLGGQDLAGISGASKYGGELDPNAPINKMLTDLGFTANKIGALASEIDTMDPAAWMKQLNDLVGIVAGAGTLGKQLSKTYAETVSDAAAEAAKSPAGKLADQAAAVTDLLKAVSFYTGAEQITKGQEAITAAQQFYDNAKAAMLQLSAMAEQTTQDVADETKKIQDSLKTPSELFDQSFTNLQADYLKMKNATDPEDLAKAWASAKSDFEAVAGELVNRIKQISSLLDDIHTLQLAIANGPAPDQNAAPGAWLRQNMLDITKYETAMKAANPGSPEEISAATTMAGLIRDRYQMELQLLDRIKSAIASINDTIDQQLFNIDLGEAKTPDDKSKLIYGKIEDLFHQMQQPGETPEQIQGLVSQITSLTTQFLQLSPVGTPGHDAAVTWVRQILGQVRDTSTGILGGQATSTQTDISHLGTLLGEAETRMNTALDHTTTDLETLERNFKTAGDYMTGKLNDWGVEIQNQVNALGPILTTMVTNFTDVNDALSGSGTGTGTGHGNPHIPLGDNLTGLGSGVDDANSALTDFTSTVRNATRALGGKAA